MQLPQHCNSTEYYKAVHNSIPANQDHNQHILRLLNPCHRNTSPVDDELDNTADTDLSSATFTEEIYQDDKARHMRIHFFSSVDMVEYNYVESPTDQHPDSPLFHTNIDILEELYRLEFDSQDISTWFLRPMNVMPISLYMICERLSSRPYMTILVSIVEPTISRECHKIIPSLYRYYSRSHLSTMLRSFEA